MTNKNKKQETVIWLFVDGKPGHQNQSEGLVAAITDKVTVKVQRMPVLPFWKTLKGKLFHKNHLLNFAAKPDIAIGAGHATHSSLLLTKLLFKAKTIVLMKPSLPAVLFDLCIVPEHDGISAGKRVLNTKGVLNRVQMAENKQINKGVILVGGPSKHYMWDSVSIIDQIKTILHEMPHIQWHIADSRRTPEETSNCLSGFISENVFYYPVDSVDSQWLPEMLSDANYAWVSEDSVSMVYEALTAGCMVGLLAVEQILESRVSKGVSKLLKENLVIEFDQWHKSLQMHEPVQGFNEAKRCADEIVKKWQLVS